MPEKEGRSMLGEDKYSPGVGPSWKAESDRFLAFYKALVNKSNPDVRTGLCKVARSQVRNQGGLTHSREGSHVYSNDLDQSRCP